VGVVTGSLEDLRQERKRNMPQNRRGVRHRKKSRAELSEELSSGANCYGSRYAAIAWPLRTSNVVPTMTGWFQVFPLSAGTRAISVN